MSTTKQPHHGFLHSLALHSVLGMGWEQLGDGAQIQSGEIHSVPSAFVNSVEPFPRQVRKGMRGVTGSSGLPWTISSDG